jgi:hypothetical protein
MDERLQFVARRLAGEAMAELCREFGISRKTGASVWATKKLISARFSLVRLSVSRRSKKVFGWSAL